MPGRGLQDIPLRIPDKWDAAWFAKFVREVLAQADIRNAVPGTGIAITGNSSEPATVSADSSITGLLNVPFVTLSPSSQLIAERVITAGDGIALTDGGAGSTLTISVDDIPYDLFGDLPPLSIFGNQLPTAAPPGAIGGIQQGDLLWIRDVDGLGTLNVQFSNEPIWSGDHQWLDGVGIALGTGQDLTLLHDGTDSEIVNVTGNLTIENTGGDVSVTALEEFIVTTDGTQRIRIDADGALLLAGDAGTATQILTSGGTGVPPTWEDAPGGGGGGSLVYVNTTVPAGNTVANTTTETAFASGYDIAANSLAVGSVIRVRLFGVVSNTGTPTLRIRIKLDATTVIDTTAITTITGLANAGWYTEAQLVVTAIGGSGSIDAQGRVGLPISATDTQVIPTPNTTGIAADTAQALTVTVTAQWGAADPANTITLRQMTIWLEAAVANSTTLSDVVLADTPTAFWKLDEASGTFVDSSGNGFDLTTIAGSPVYQRSVLIPSLASVKFVQFPSGAASARLTSSLGTSPPLVGDWSFELCICPRVFGANPFRPFALAGVGGTAAANQQIIVQILNTGEFRVGWESGSGVQQVVTSSINLAEGTACHLVAVKDGTAKIVTFFINGIQVAEIGYATEPAGGTGTLIASIGEEPDAGGDSGDMLIGYVAVYNGIKLSAARVVAHAQVAGFF